MVAAFEEDRDTDLPSKDLRASFIGSAVTVAAGGEGDFLNQTPLSYGFSGCREVDVLPEPLYVIGGRLYGYGVVFRKWRTRQDSNL
jgi:hypothetical protein